MHQVGGRWRRARGWLVGCEGDGGGHMGAWLAGLPGASNSCWKPGLLLVSLSLYISIYIYMYIYN
jgi:hypothetical protein